MLLATCCLAQKGSMNFTLDQLRAIDAIDRTGSFAAAARELHRVPSAITYLVRGLEDALDVTLFERRGRRSVLTPEGRRVLESARDVLAPARALAHTAAELASGWAPELHVVTDASLPFAPIIAALERFAAPDVPTRLRVDVECQDGVMDRMRRDHADVALYLGFDAEADARGWRTRPLPPLGFRLVAARSHPVIVDNAPLDLHPQLVVRDTARTWDDTPKPAWSGRRNITHIGDFHTKRATLLAGVGYGWMPDHLIGDDLAEGRLEIVPTHHNRWTWNPVIVRPADATNHRAVDLFVQTLEENLPDY